MRSTFLALSLTASLALALSGPALAETKADPEAALIAILESATKLDSRDPAELRAASYAACMLFGHNGEATVGVFTQEGWTRQDHPEDATFEMRPPGDAAEELYVITDQAATFCGVWSGSQGTDATRDAMTAILNSTGEAVEMDSSEDGCPLAILTSADASMTTEVYASEGGCDSADESFALFSAVPHE